MNRRPSRSNPLPLILGIGLAVILAGGAGAVLLVGSGGEPDDPAVAKNSADTDPPTEDSADVESPAESDAPIQGARLVIDWPESERAGGSFVINRRSYTVSPAGPIQLPLRPGPYRIELRAAEGRVSRHQVVLADGTTETVVPQWTAGDAPESADIAARPWTDDSGFPDPSAGDDRATPRPVPEGDPWAAEEPPAAPDPQPTEPTPAEPPVPSGDAGENPFALPDEGEDGGGSTPAVAPPTAEPNPVAPPDSPQPPAEEPVEEPTAELAAEPPAEPAADPPVGSAVEQKLVGKTATLLFWKATSLDDVEITAVEPGTADDTLTSVTIKSGRSSRKIAVAALSRIVLGEQIYSIKKAAESSDFTLFDVNKHLEAVDADLRRRGQMLWPKLTDEQQAAIIKNQKEFLDEVGERFNGMRLYETKYFLFYTDIPAQQVEFFVGCLDEMYDKLCGMFGVTGGKNIWWGKAVVVAFLNESSYHAFEQTFMRNPNSQGSAGLHHGFSNGRVVIAIFRGDNPHDFAHTLVHETTHGFIHRQKSNVHIVSWVNEGVAEWVAHQVVPQCRQIPLKEAAALMQLKQTGSLGGNFFAENKNIDAWQYGVAYQVTKLMIGVAPMRYGLFIDGIKEGKSVEESLKETYGWTFAKLAQVYGQAVGLPLRP
jgi:hypothetical protein